MHPTDSPTVSATWRTGMTRPWSGRGGGRHYLLWRSFLRLAATEGTATDEGWLVTASLRDLHTASLASSKSGMARSLDYLAAEGLLAVHTPGQADHDGQRGRRTVWLVRHLGSMPVGEEEETSISESLSGSSLSSTPISPAHRPPLPDMPEVELSDDLVEEPHYVRFLDLVAAGLAEASVQHSPAALGRLLGVARQSAAEMMRRWAERSLGLGVAVMSSANLREFVACFRREHRSDEMDERHARESVVRKQALEGRWVRRSAPGGRWLHSTTRFAPRRSPRTRRSQRVALSV